MKRTLAALTATMLWSGGAMTKTLDEIKKSFFEVPLNFEPVAATYIGYPGFDDRLRIRDEASRDEERRFYTQLIANLEAYRHDLLAQDDLIDVQIMRANAIWNLQNLEQPYPLGWRSETDCSNLVDTIYHNISRSKGKPEEWEAILSRMKLIPDILAQRRKNLEQGLKEKVPFYKREVQRDGIDLTAEVSRYFVEAVPAAAKPSLGPTYSQFASRLAEAGKAIEQALTAYAAFLKSDVLPKAKDDAFAIGEEEYAWRLRNLLYSTESPASLFEYGKAEVAKTAKEMQSVADEIQSKAGKPSKPFAEVVAELQKNAPLTDSEAFEMYRTLTDRAVAFVREKKLFRLPKDYSINIVETPAAYHNVLSVAAMNPIPPFLDGVPAQFWVTPTRTKKYPEGDAALLRDNHNRASAPNLVVHEAVPGHDLQLGDAARRFISGGRKDLSYLARLGTPGIMMSLGVEGWAHYTEQLMAEEEFYTPEEKLFQLKDAQWRNVRVVVDAGIHTGRMTYDDAIAYFDQHTMSGKVTAEREIYRYSKWPLQAVTYHLGKRDILRLRNDVKEAVGERHFDLAVFHEMLLAYDGVPVSLYADELLAKAKDRMVPSIDSKRTKKGSI